MSVWAPSIYTTFTCCSLCVLFLLARYCCGEHTASWLLRMRPHTHTHTSADMPRFFMLPSSVIWISAFVLSPQISFGPVVHFCQDFISAIASKRFTPRSIFFPYFLMLSQMRRRNVLIYVPTLMKSQVKHQIMLHELLEYLYVLFLFVCSFYDLKTKCKTTQLSQLFRLVVQRGFSHRHRVEQATR